jgi:hypothetical protein
VEARETLPKTNSAMHLFMLSMLLLCCVILNEIVRDTVKNQSFISVIIRSELLCLVLMQRVIPS